MNKHILALSMIAALSGCQLDNSDAKKVPANFNNEYKTEVGFDGSSGEGLDVELTTGHGNASGIIGVTDVNYGEADPDYTKIPEAKYGIFTMNEADDGEWTYDLDESHPDVAAIMNNPDGMLTDTITLTSLDGTKAELNFIIKGLDPDIEAEFRGAFVANVSLTETTGFGKAEVYDENFDESSFQSVGEAKYGTFTMNPDGRWIYELDKTHPDLQSLTEPEHSTQETFTVYSKDGTANQFTVNITGAPLNFAAQIPSSTTATNVFAVNLFQGTITEDDARSGILSFKAKITEDLLSTAKIGMTCDSWNGNNDGGGDNRRLAQFFIKGDLGGQFEMWSAEIVPGGSYENGIADYARNENNQYITQNVVFDQMFTPGEWTDFIMSWEYDSSSNLSKLTLSIDNVAVSSDHGAIPADPSQKIIAQTVAGSRLYDCLQEIRFFIPKNDEKGGMGALLIDDIKYYTNIDADIQFDTPDFEETFSNSNAGDSVKGTGVPNPFYKNITTDSILVVRDL